MMIDNMLICLNNGALKKDFAKKIAGAIGAYNLVAPIKPHMIAVSIQ